MAKCRRAYCVEAAHKADITFGQEGASERETIRHYADHRTGPVARRVSDINRRVQGNFWDSLRAAYGDTA